MCHLPKWSLSQDLLIPKLLEFVVRICLHLQCKRLLQVITFQLFDPAPSWHLYSGPPLLPTPPLCYKLEFESGRSKNSWQSDWLIFWTTLHTLIQILACRSTMGWRSISGNPGTQCRRQTSRGEVQYMADMQSRLAPLIVYYRRYKTPMSSSHHWELRSVILRSEQHTGSQAHPPDHRWR